MKILIVDDDYSFAIMLQQQLVCYEIAAVALDSVDEALELLRQETFDALISDIKMETELEGVTFLEEAHRLNPEMGRLIVTGYDKDFDWAYKTPGVARLKKPCDIEDLLFALKLLTETPTIEDAARVLDDITRQIQDSSIDTREIERTLNGLRSAILENGISEHVRRLIESCQRIEEHLHRTEGKFTGKIDGLEGKFASRINEICSTYKVLMRYVVTGILGALVTLIGLILKEIVFK